MRSLICLAAVGIVALAVNGYAQEPQKPPEKAEITKAMYMVTGLHCPPCAATVEGSLKKVKGVNAVKVDYQGKSATIEFEEKVISAQEVVRAMSVTPHMMGRGMQYGGSLLLSVPEFKDEATGNKAKAALSKVEGVAKVNLYPQQKAVGIDFADKGKATSKQLIGALDAAGLKGTQYGTPNGPAGQGANGRSGAMPDHAGMPMGNGNMAGPSMGGGCGCGCCRR